MLSLIAALAIASLQDSALERVGPLSEIYESYNDCFAATADGKLQPDALVEKGWIRATSDGEPTNSPMIYGRGDRAPMLMLNGEEGGSGICVVMARFENAASVREFLSAWGEGLPEFVDGQLSFFAEGQPIMFRQSGTQEKPRLNLIIGTGTETSE